MKTESDFDRWNEVKKITNFSLSRDIKKVFFREREIWWCYLGVNIGFEEDGKGERSMRPVLVVRKFSPRTFVGIPLTTSDKTNQYHIACFARDGKSRWAIISQLKVIDVRRLHRKMTSITEEHFSAIRKAVRGLF